MTAIKIFFFFYFQQFEYVPGSFAFLVDTVCFGFLFVCLFILYLSCLGLSGYLGFMACCLL